MVWELFITAALFLAAVTIIVIWLTWDTKPPQPESIQGERRTSVLNYYALTEGVPTADEVACLRTCEASVDCSAVFPTHEGRKLTCEILTQAQVAQTTLEGLTAQPGFVKQNQVPLPASHVYFGQGVYSTTGRYWIQNRRHLKSRVIRQDLFSYQQLPWRPKSIVRPAGSVGIYTPSKLDDLSIMHPTEWFTLEGVLPVYIHRPGEPLQVPVFWKTPWVVYA